MASLNAQLRAIDESTPPLLLTVQSDIYPPPCIHSEDGKTLCPRCQREFEVDPIAYVEYGDHPAGIVRWEEERQSWASSPFVAASDDLPL